MRTIPVLKLLCEDVEEGDSAGENAPTDTTPPEMTPPDPNNDDGDNEQNGKDTKRMSKKELDKAARNNGYKDAHDMKRDYQLDSKRDIFVDKNGNMYEGPRQGTGTPQSLGINIYGT